MSPLNAIESFGAVPEALTDNTAALVTALKVASMQRRQLLLPAGSYGYSDVLNVLGVELVCEHGATLHALNTARCALILQGLGPKVIGLRFTGVKPTVRTSADVTSRIVVNGARGFAVDGVTIESASGAGIMVRQSTDGIVAHCKVSDTLADSIHVTEWSSYITIEDNETERSGDDGIAVVSYRHQGSPVNNVAARWNRIRNNRGGRCMSVVGGTDVIYEGNELEGNLTSAGLIIAQEEGTYKTFGSNRVTARLNTIINCGNRTKGHGGITVVGAGGPEGGPAVLNTGITLERNLVVQDDATLLAIRILSAHNREVLLDQNVPVAATPMQIVTPADVTVRRYTGGRVGVGPR